MTQPMPPQTGQQLPVVLGDPPGVNFRVGCTPPDAAGKAYPVLAVQHGAVTIEIRLTPEGARDIGANLGPHLMAAADEATTRSSGIVVPPPGFVLPTPGPNRADRRAAGQRGPLGNVGGASGA